MKIIGVIPARYGSTRFPGKPLADICGKPMIWWVYQQVKKVKAISDVIIATDDQHIYDVCMKLSLEVEMTRNDHKTSTERVYEITKKRKADLYIVINGDEPLIKPETIEKIIPSGSVSQEFYAANLMTEIKSPAETVDFTNIKVVTDEDSNALFMSRSPIPYPKSSVDYKYYKHVGVLIYNINALRFFVTTEKGHNEKIEDINELRFIEHGKKLKMIEVNSENLSVDTPKDLEHISRIITERQINEGKN